MDSDLTHLIMAFTFLALWAMIGHIAVASRRSRQDERGSNLPASGNIGQR
jgi:hypothetical protein